MQVELRKQFQFEAAHYLPNLPRDHKCRRIHGHSFKVEVAVAGTCDPHCGWLIDYAAIKKAFEPILEELDHRLLNEVPGLENPTSENLARWIWDRLHPNLSGLKEVVVAETCTSRCIYRGEQMARTSGLGPSLAKTNKQTQSSLVVQLDHLEPVACPCGLSRRAFLDIACSPASVHLTEIDGESVPHYHAYHTEIYVVIEGHATIELDDKVYQLSPLSCVMIPPGCVHRVSGKVKLINFVTPPFDSSDEHFVQRQRACHFPPAPNSKPIKEDAS